jgi:hypothetical protein
MKTAVSSRVFPLFTYEPARSKEWTVRWSLDGNPDVTDLWPAADDVTLTPADWFAVEGRFAHLFELVPKSEQDESQVPLAAFLELSEEERRDRTAYVTVEDTAGRSRRLRVSDQLISAIQQIGSNWRLLQEITGTRSTLMDIARDQVREELQASFDAQAEEIKSEADARVSALQNQQEAVFRDKLTARLLTLSGFLDTGGSLADWLSEMEQRGRQTKTANGDSSGEV